MKVAISTQGKGMESKVDPRFGRAAYFLIVDVETGESKAVENTRALNAPQGAGIQAAQLVAGQGVEYVLTGNCGPKAFMALNTAGIKVVLNVEGIVGEVLEGFKRGNFEVARQANVSGHWATRDDAKEV